MKNFKEGDYVSILGYNGSYDNGQRKLTSVYGTVAALRLDAWGGCEVLVQRLDDPLLTAWISSGRCAHDKPFHAMTNEEKKVRIESKLTELEKRISLGLRRNGKPVTTDNQRASMLSEAERLRKALIN